jgi:hypothetical protein
MGQQNQYLWYGSSNTDFLPVSHVCKEMCLMYKNMSMSLKKVQFKMWFDGNNESLNSEFMSHSTLVK